MPKLPSNGTGGRTPSRAQAASGSQTLERGISTGHNPLAPPGIPLQVMPWPFDGKLLDQDLRAIYEYLRAIPSLPDNPNPGP